MVGCGLLTLVASFGLSRFGGFVIRAADNSGRR
jgi:hypothetical protein